MLGKFPPWVIVVVVGALSFAFLHVHFMLAWEDLYVTAPWPGIEAFAHSGLVDPWFGNTPRSLRLTQISVFALAMVIGLIRPAANWKMALALWIGVMLPLIPVLVARSILSETGLVTATGLAETGFTALALPLEAIRIAAPIVAGALAASILRRVGAALGAVFR